MSKFKPGDIVKPNYNYGTGETTDIRLIITWDKRKEICGFGQPEAGKNSVPFIHLSEINNKNPWMVQGFDPEDKMDLVYSFDDELQELLK